MLLESCINLDTWFTFNFEYELFFGTLLSCGTMCNLRYVNKVADNAAVSFDSKSFLGSFSATLFETIKHPIIRTALVMKEMHI